MGIAASTALRDDSSANRPAYGSLEGLGGPRQFKKKPVLVLDPEELAAAHAMFHEASAELLGEEVERVARPKSILGLAPMVDDDPEEFGQSDEIEDEDGDDLPSPDAVLSLTRRRSTPLADDDDATDGLDDYFGAPDDDMDELGDGGFINDGLDMSTRIFPSLPIRHDLEEEEDEEAAESLPIPSAPARKPAMPQPQARQAEPPVAPPAERSPAPLAPPPVARAPEEVVRREAPPAAEPPVAKSSEAKTPAPPAPTPAPTAQPVAKALPEAEPAKAAMPQPPATHAPTDKPRPARFDEVNPSKDYGTPEDVFDLDRWMAEPQDEPAQPGPEARADTPPAPEMELSAEQEVPTEEAALVPQGSTDEPSSEGAPSGEGSSDETDEGDFTVTGNDNVDGYAFMRDPRSKRAVISAAQQGRQSALRAKLMREEEHEAARIAAQKQANPVERSLLLRLWEWMRRLFA